MEHFRKPFKELDFPVTIEPIMNFRRNHFFIDIKKNKKGREVFTIEISDLCDLKVIDRDIKEKALLISAKAEHSKVVEFSGKYLLGHDERQLFVAPVSGDSKNVKDAKQKLKPKLIVEAENLAYIKTAKLHKHKNKARIRQGDYFFLPRPNVEIVVNLIQLNKAINPYSRGNKHYAEYSYHTPPVQIGAMTFPSRLYVKGKVRHKEHATVNLQDWNLVIHNTERDYSIMENILYHD